MGKHVIALSGGKDSTAMALFMHNENPDIDYEYICNETGNELPDMTRHWDRLEGMLGSEIVRVRSDRGLVEECRHQKMLPNVFARWCTRTLKIEPSIDYMQSLPDGSILYVGLRADEQDRKGLYGDDVEVKFPLREMGWKEADVYRYLEEKGVCIPRRTDCALCPYQRLGEWRDLFEVYPDLYQLGVELEAEIGATIRSPGRDTWPAGLDALRSEFKSGRKLRSFKNGNKCRVCSF